ncbi:MAG: hypothetical protein IPP40_17370 [bacterium]|nr:hypothetical protein [bacterium]
MSSKGYPQETFGGEDLTMFRCPPESRSNSPAHMREIVKAESGNGFRVVLFR